MNYSLWQQKDHFNHIHLQTIGGGYPQPGQAFAGGGAVLGGRGGIDDIDAKLTAGEFVVNKSAASRYMPLLRQINAQRFADGGEVLPLSLLNNQSAAQHLASQPTPSLPSVSDAGHPQQPAAQPPSTPATPVPTPGVAAPPTPTTPTGGVISPSLAAPQVAAAPSNLDHNLKAIDTGIDSGAQAIGQALSTAIGVAGGAGGGFGGGAVGAIGPYVAGLVQQGGKIAKNLVTMSSHPPFWISVFCSMRPNLADSLSGRNVAMIIANAPRTTSINATGFFMRE